MMVQRRLLASTLARRQALGGMMRRTLDLTMDVRVNVSGPKSSASSRGYYSYCSEFPHGNFALGKYSQSFRLHKKTYQVGLVRAGKRVISFDKIQSRSNFSFAGPRKLSDIVKTELLGDKTRTEISHLWMTYHEGKEKVHGLVLNAEKGRRVLARASQCPFFIHPIFREEGHFMIVSQFLSPNHFLFALLEDYKMDPSRAQPLLTISFFNDFSESKDLALIRCDVINQGIEDDEGYTICKLLIDDYCEEDKFRVVHLFNKKPDAFDIDNFVRAKELSWKEYMKDSKPAR